MSMAALAIDDEYCTVVAGALKRDPRSAKVIALRIGTTPRTVENWRDGLNEPRGRLFFKLAMEVPELRRWPSNGWTLTTPKGKTPFAWLLS